MTLRMVVESDLASLSTPLQYIELSDAFLDSAIRLCTVLRRSPRKSNYARSAVVQYLAFHAIELFLKSAILKQHPNEKLNTHDIQTLSKRYRNLYKAKKYEFHAPFLSEEISDDVLSKIIGFENLENFKSSRKKHEDENPWDQRLRYPINDKGQPWSGLVGFEPLSYLLELKKLQKTFGMLAELIFPDRNLLRVKHLKSPR